MSVHVLVDGCRSEGQKKRFEDIITEMKGGKEEEERKEISIGGGRGGGEGRGGQRRRRREGVEWEKEEEENVEAYVNFIFINLSSNE